MELITAILIALRLLLNPGISIDEYKASHPAEYQKATQVMNSGSYKVDPATGDIIIIDETGN